jgi:hypothetical protein
VGARQAGTFGQVRLVRTAIPSGAHAQPHQNRPKPAPTVVPARTGRSSPATRGPPDRGRAGPRRVINRVPASRAGRSARSPSPVTRADGKSPLP